MSSALTQRYDQFVDRHNGPHNSDLPEMLRVIGASSLDQLIDETVPPQIRMESELAIPQGMSEYYFLQHLQKIAAKNEVYRSFIGMGYYGTITPSVILRNVFQNPGWYTQYTPYQAEIAQGRLEALLNYQTMVSDLTGLPIANASLLDEGTAAAEAMSMFYAQRNKRNKQEKVNVFLVSDQVFPQTIAVLETRAEPLGIEVRVQPVPSFEFPENEVFGILLQYPGADGEVADYRTIAAQAKEANVYVTVAADLLALTLLIPPGEWGADAVVGNTQRFGVPMGYGGPHAAYFAVTEDFKRQIPGRIIGVSQDRHGHRALRMALQTREQHIRREKATSNICTAQALLANMAGFYAVYHGAEGLTAIASRVHQLTAVLADALLDKGYTLRHSNYFDTLDILIDTQESELIRKRALEHGFNLFYHPTGIRISLDETVSSADLSLLAKVFEVEDFIEAKLATSSRADITHRIPDALKRQSAFLTHPNFHLYQTETELMRCLKRLENQDLSLMHSMIPLGSCTMKLNAATELLPVSWPAFADLHPFCTVEQPAGYREIFHRLEEYLAEITGFTATSLQPNSGAAGEYAGLMTIRAYHLDRGDDHRKVALIPESAHGTNPASLLWQV